MQNGSGRKSNITRKTSTGIARRTLILAAVAALGLTAAGKSVQAAITEQVQDYTGGSGGFWGTNTNWAGGAGTTVPNNGTPANTVYVIDTAAGNAGPVDLHHGSFTIAGIGNLSGSTTELTEIENSSGNATLIIDPNTMPIPAASVLNSAVTGIGSAHLTLQFGTGSGVAITSTINGVISGTEAALVVDGPSGSVVLTANNTYGVENASGQVTTIENGATLTVTGSITSAVNMTGTGTSTFNVENSFGIGDLVGGVYDAIVISSGDTLTITPVGAHDFAGEIFGAGGIELTGTHELTLSGVNTYSGGTIIGSAGATLKVTGAIEGPVAVNSGTFEVANNFDFITDLTGNSTGNIYLDTGDTLLVDPSQNDTYSGTISGTGGFDVYGGYSGNYYNTLTLAGTLTYTGETYVYDAQTLTLTGTGDVIGAVYVNQGTLNIDPNVSITDLTGYEGTVNLYNSDVLTVNTTTSDDFEYGTFTGSGSTGLTIDGTHGGSLKFDATDMTSFSGTITLQNGGALDISNALNNPDDSSDAATSSGAFIDYGTGVVKYFANFTNDIVFGTGGGTLTVGQGGINDAQSTDFSNDGVTSQNSLGEELSGSISLTGNSITATIKSNAGDPTLITGAINNTNANNEFLLQNTAGTTSTFIFANDSNSTTFTAGTLRLGLHGSAPTMLMFDVQNQNGYGNAGYLPGPNVTIVLDGGWLSSDGSYGFNVTNNIKLTDHQGGIISGGFGYGAYYNPVNYSGTISGLYGSGGKLTIQNDGVGYYYYGETVELSGNNTYSDGTTVGGNDGGYINAMAGSNTAFGTGELVLASQGGLSTTNDIDGVRGGTPIHVMVSSFDSSASDYYVGLAVLNQATNITFSGGMYHVNNANASDNTNDAIIITGGGNANIGDGPDQYLNFYPFTSSNDHARPYDFSKFVVVDTGSGGTVTGPFSRLESTGYLDDGNSYGGGPMYLTQVNQSNGAGGEETVVTVQTDFAAFAHNHNEYNVAHYIDTFATPGNEGNLSPGLISALITLSQAPDKDIAGALALITPGDYESLGDQAVQNSTYESQQIFGQIDSAFSVGGFNTGGLALLQNPGAAPSPFSTALEASLNSSAQMAQNTANANVGSLSSVNFMDDNAGNNGSPNSGPPVPEQESPQSNLSGFVSGDIIMSNLPEGSTLSQPHYTTGGVTAGIDYRLNENWIIGGYFNYGYTGATLDFLGSRQQSESYSPGLFVGYENGPWFLDLLGSYTYNDYRIDRNFPIGPTATGKPTSNQYDLASLFGFYVPVARNLQMGPAGGFAYTNVDVSSFSETGSPLSLSVSSHSTNSLRSLLGAQAKYTWNNNTLPVDVNFNAFWQHEFLNGSGGISAGLTNLAGAGAFIYNTTGPSRDSALVGGGVSGQVTKCITVFANYESQIGDRDVFGQSVIAGLAISFK